MSNVAPLAQHGHLFREARYALNLSPDNIAKLLGVASDRTIRRWEGNKLDIPTYVWNVVTAELMKKGEHKIAKNIYRTLSAASPKISLSTRSATS